MARVRLQGLVAQPLRPGDLLGLDLRCLLAVEPLRAARLDAAGGGYLEVEYLDLVAGQAVSEVIAFLGADRSARRD